MLGATYSRKRCSRTETNSTHAVLSHTRPNGQKVFERVYEYKHTEQVSSYKVLKKRKFSHRMIKIARVEIVPLREHLFRE